jgi:hypothetical protein
MRIWLTAALILSLTACSETPTETKAKAPEKPPEPITGRQAFQYTFPSARTWAPDCQPLRIRNVNLEEVPSVEGKAGAWEVTFVSPQLAKTRSYTWSAVEVDGGLHKGVFKGIEESWGGPRGQEQPFLPAALKVDTPEALEKASAKSSEYLKRPGTKPPVTFLLESTTRFPNPTWRVMWGSSPSTAEYSVFVDASTGNVVSVVR